MRALSISEASFFDTPGENGYPETMTENIHARWSLGIFAPPLAIGTPAPPFNMLDNTGALVSSDHLLGKKPFVLVFYPADFTAVCTAQLCALRDQYQTFADRGIEVFGVNPFNWDTHRKFAAQHRFPFRILFDPHCKYANRYHAVLIPSFINKRLVYGVGTDGTICFAKGGKPPVSDILKAFSTT